LEDGIVDGGFGGKIASFYGSSDMKVINLGLEKKFYDRYNPQQLLETLEITAEKIVERVKGVL
jgi:1-deoxy-D-xylulose-5-phosphate synthase